MGGKTVWLPLHSKAARGGILRPYRAGWLSAACLPVSLEAAEGSSLVTLRCGAFSAA
jgi:hypothetical protein